MKTGKLSILAGMAVLALSPAFQQPAAGDLIQMEVAEKVETFRKEQWEMCRQRALKAAAEQVDSLIIQWAKANRDTLGRPSRPLKPLPPERLSPTDTTPVRPFFD